MKMTGPEDVPGSSTDASCDAQVTRYGRIATRRRIPNSIQQIGPRPYIRKAHRQPTKQVEEEVESEDELVEKSEVEEKPDDETTEPEREHKRKGNKGKKYKKKDKTLRKKSPQTMEKTNPRPPVVPRMLLPFEETVTCEFCLKQMQQFQLETHIIETHTDKPRNQCLSCRVRWFNGYHEIKAHYKRCSEGRLATPRNSADNGVIEAEHSCSMYLPASCPHCPLIFSTMFDLAVHLRMHNIDPYDAHFMCAGCYKPFSTIDAAHQHVLQLKRRGFTCCDDKIVVLPPEITRFLKEKNIIPNNPVYIPEVTEGKFTIVPPRIENQETCRRCAFCDEATVSYVMACRDLSNLSVYGLKQKSAKLTKEMMAKILPHHVIDDVKKADQTTPTLNGSEKMLVDTLEEGQTPTTSSIAKAIGTGSTSGRTNDGAQSTLGGANGIAVQAVEAGGGGDKDVPPTSKPVVTVEDDPVSKERVPVCIAHFVWKNGTPTVQYTPKCERKPKEAARRDWTTINWDQNDPNSKCPLTLEEAMGMMTASSGTTPPLLFTRETAKRQKDEGSQHSIAQKYNGSRDQSIESIDRYQEQTKERIMEGREVDQAMAEFDEQEEREMRALMEEQLRPKRASSGSTRAPGSHDGAHEAPDGEELFEDDLYDYDDALGDMFKEEPMDVDEMYQEGQQREGEEDEYEDLQDEPEPGPSNRKGSGGGASTVLSTTADSMRERAMVDLNTARTCPICAAHCETLYQLHEHQKEHVGKFRYSCADCPSQFWTVDEVVKHFDEKTRSTVGMFYSYKVTIEVWTADGKTLCENEDTE